MKKLFAALLLTTFSTGVLAHGYEHREYHEHHGGGGGNWIAPLIIGGVAGYVLAQPRTVVVQQPPPVVYNLSTGPYCPAPYSPVYNTVWVYDAYGRAMQQTQFIGCQ